MRQKKVLSNTISILVEISFALGLLQPTFTSSAALVVFYWGKHEGRSFLVLYAELRPGQDWPGG